MRKIRRNKINELADIIRSALKYTSAPYDPRNAVTQLGGLIVEDQDLEKNNIDAKIINEEGNFKIFLNPKKSQERISFSIAHELGHLFLHMGFIIDEAKWKTSSEYEDSYNRTSYNTYMEEEYEANEFAAAFLMPKDEFIDLVYQNIDEQGNSANLEKIANHFAVSIQAVINRGRWLGVFAW